MRKSHKKIQYRDQKTVESLAPLIYLHHDSCIYALKATQKDQKRQSTWKPGVTVSSRNGFTNKTRAIAIINRYANADGENPMGS